jgi:adenylate cyclase
MLKLTIRSEGRAPASHELREGQTYILGVSPEADLNITGEPYLSRKHVALSIHDGKLSVKRLSTARNPVLYKGAVNDRFEMPPGGFFVIGKTQFRFDAPRPAGKDVDLASVEQIPVYQFTLDRDELRPRTDRQDRLRLLDLMELPEILRTKSRTEFYVYACGLLRMATGAQWVRVLTADSAGQTILAEDARADRAAPKPISDALIAAAVAEAPKPVTYCWSHPQESAVQATAYEGVDWAISCAMPIPGESPVLIYVVGTSEAVGSYLGYDTQSGAKTFLRDTARLVGLVADMIGRAMSLQKVEAWQSRLGRFFSGKLVNKILEAEGTEELKPKIAEATVMFFDIRGFAALTEDSLTRILEYEGDLRRVLTAMTQCIYDHDGVVLRYMGDGILACWNVPYAVDAHVTRAAQAALTMVETMADVTDGWDCGIGLGVGEVVAGSLGSDQVYAYDILGAVANQTARVEGITKIVGVPILVTDAVVNRLPRDEILSRRVARFRPVGMELVLDLYTIERAPADAAARAAVIARLETHAKGLESFEAGDWKTADETLYPVVQDDPAAKYVYKLAIQGKPPRDWEGIVELTAK